MDFDPYSVLGVLPGADQVVINAAYRALAQRYHPDRWSGDPAVAHDRMAEINKAYEILGDVDKRRAFDAAKSNDSPGDFGKRTSDQEDAFHSEFLSRHKDWMLAVELYPDLEPLRNRLKRISEALSFEFVTVVLDERIFKSRKELAIRLEETYLKRYFGSDKKILGFARDLILAGRKDAALKLNKYINLLGGDAEAHVLIAKINMDFPLRESDSSVRRAANFERCRELYSLLKRHEMAIHAVQLGVECKYKITSSQKGLFLRNIYKVVSPTGPIFEFSGDESLVSWALREFKDYD